jgi:flagellar hook-length control protein FliK
MDLRPVYRDRGEAGPVTTPSLSAGPAPAPAPLESPGSATALTGFLGLLFMVLNIGTGAADPEGATASGTALPAPEAQPAGATSSDGASRARPLPAPPTTAATPGRDDEPAACQAPGDPGASALSAIAILAPGIAGAPVRPTPQESAPTAVDARADSSASPLADVTRIDDTVSGRPRLQVPTATPPASPGDPGYGTAPTRAAGDTRDETSAATIPPSVRRGVPGSPSDARAETLADGALPGQTQPDAAAAPRPAPSGATRTTASGATRPPVADDARAAIAGDASSSADVIDVRPLPDASRTARASAPALISSDEAPAVASHAVAPGVAEQPGLLPAEPASPRIRRATDVETKDPAASSPAAGRAFTVSPGAAVTAVDATGTDERSGRARRRSGDGDANVSLAHDTLAGAASVRGATSLDGLDAARDDAPVLGPRSVPAIADTVSAIVREGVNHVEVLLEPPALGSVRVSAEVDGTRLGLTISAERPETRALLLGAIPELTAALGLRGITPSSIAVTAHFDPPADRQAAPRREPERQARTPQERRRSARDPRTIATVDLRV